MHPYDCAVYHKYSTKILANSFSFQYIVMIHLDTFTEIMFILDIYC